MRPPDHPCLLSQPRQLSSHTTALLHTSLAQHRSGADKVSIGSDAVEAAEQYYASGCKLAGNTAIEEISKVYGKQAVVVSIDPRRVYVSDPAETPHTCVKASKPGPNGERWCWWQCTVMGGREGRDIDAVQVGVDVSAVLFVVPAAASMLGVRKLKSDGLEWCC